MYWVSCSVRFQHGCKSSVEIKKSLSRCTGSLHEVANAKWLSRCKAVGLWRDVGIHGNGGGARVKFLASALSYRMCWGFSGLLAVLEASGMEPFEGSSFFGILVLHP